MSGCPPMEPRKFDEKLCRTCKEEFRDGEREQEDVATASMFWYVEEDGTVVYENRCHDGHEPRRKKVEPMAGKHSHPGHPRRHPVTREHQDEESCHLVPEDAAERDADER